jgi:hypothetical protein
MGAGARADYESFDVRWFAWRAVREALAHGRGGGIALHRFRHDLRRFGLSAAEPACHMLSADRAALVAFASQFGLRAIWIEPPDRDARTSGTSTCSVWSCGIWKLSIRRPPGWAASKREHEG